MSFGIGPKELYLLGPTGLITFRLLLEFFLVVNLSSLRLVENMILW